MRFENGVKQIPRTSWISEENQLYDKAVIRHLTGLRSILQKEIGLQKTRSETQFGFRILLGWGYWPVGYIISFLYQKLEEGI